MKINWRKGSFIIYTGCGPMIKLGHVSPLFAIDERNPKEFFVTHRPTGLHVDVLQSEPFKTAAQAKIFCERIMPVLNWKKATKGNTIQRNKVEAIKRTIIGKRLTP